MIFKIPVDGYCGNPLDCENCPVANAIKPFLAEGVTVTVTHDHCTLFRKSPKYATHRIAFDAKITDLISAIDRGVRNTFFTLTLDIPLGWHKPV